MAIKTKTSLKSFFEKGDQPTSAQFSHLVDSMIRIPVSGASAKVGFIEVESTASATAHAFNSFIRTFITTINTSAAARNYFAITSASAGGGGAAGQAILAANTTASVVSLMDAVPGAKNASANLIVKNNASTPASQIDIDADEVVLKTADGAEGRVVASVNLTVDITASGANGLDTGAEASNTWYYVWVIYNPATATAAGLLSTSSSSPTMPAGYTYKALVSNVYNDSSGNFRNFWQSGKEIWSNESSSGWQVLTSGVSTSADATDLSTFVSPLAVAARATLSLQTPGAAGAYTAVVRNVNGGSTYNKISVVSFTTDTTRRSHTADGLCPLTTPQTVWYLVTDASATLALTVIGAQLP